MKRKSLTASLGFVLLIHTGCKDGVNETPLSPPVTNAAPQTTTFPDKTTTQVDINVDPDDSRTANRVERRENLRDAIDDVEVNVQDGKVDVDVKRD